MVLLYIEPKSTDATFHFSAEEYCMTHFPQNESVLMLWRTGLCAMLGCNQIADAEIDLALAKRMSIHVVRRQSGGGTIFTDLGTLLYTVILPYRRGDDPKLLERDFAVEPMVRALNSMGIPVYPEGRNDILVDGKKVSGLAQFIKGDRLCTHGSLLYDADLEMLSAVLKQDAEKISTKALRSVRDRVTNLSQYPGAPPSMRTFWNDLKEKLFTGGDVREYTLTETDIAEIQKIRREKYAHPDWLFGRTPRFDFHNRKRFAMGNAEVFLEIVKGRIASCRIRGDFLGLEAITGLETQLEGKPYRIHSIREVLERTNLRLYMGGITSEELLQCLFNT
jgi:lipoate-protein ligase A